MNINLSIVASLVSISFIAHSESLPPPPEIYIDGPTSPLLAQTDLSAAERAAYALLEGVMQMAEARILATNCLSSSGSYEISLFSDGSNNNPDFNFADVLSPGSSFSLDATLLPWNSFSGQKIEINQSSPGALKQVELSNYSAQASYNAKGTILLMDSHLDVKGNNGRFNPIQGRVIKDFYAVKDSSTNLPYILDWGVQSISRLGYPLQQYWQRSKVLRNDGEPGRTVFVKDRTIGPTSCRIVIDTHDYNNQDFFYQNGTLTISTDIPSTPVSQFNF